MKKRHFILSVTALAFIMLCSFRATKNNTASLVGQSTVMKAKSKNSMALSNTGRSEAIARWLVGFARFLANPHLTQSNISEDLRIKSLDTN